MQRILKNTYALCVNLKGGQAVKKQKAFGVFAIILSQTMLYFSSKAVLLEDKECSMALFILALGAWSLFTKQDIWE